MKLNKPTLITTGKACSSTAVLAGFLLATTACNLQPPVSACPNSCAEAALAKTSVLEGKNKAQALSAEISGIINRYKNVHPAAQAIIVEPPVHPAATLIATEISQYYGVYTETSAGVYTKSQVFTFPVIKIEQMNGTDIMFENIEHSSGEVTSYNLSILSDQRNIATPTAERVAIQLTYTFQREFTPILTILDPAQDTRGRATIMRNIAGSLTPVSYDIERSFGGQMRNGKLVTGLGTVLRVDEASTGEYWSHTSVTLYTKADPANTNSPYVGYLTTNNYQDKKVNSTTTIRATNLAELSTSSLVNFEATGEILYKAKNQLRVATVEGGPYTCNIDFPNQQGSGLSINMAYADLSSVSILPSTGFGCSTLVK